MKKIVIILISVLLCNNVVNAKTPINADRWLEIDLYWFNKDSINSSVNQFWNRNAAFFENVEGWRGIILNVGWLMDYVLDWRGNLNDKIPFPKRMNQEKWFLVEGTLNGTLAEKRKQYEQRFANPTTNLKKYYQDWTYADLKILAEQLREVGKNRYGLKDIKVGSFVLGWKSIYGGSPSNWSERHTGVYRTMDSWMVMDSFDPTSKLSDDNTHYGAFPDGVKKGMPSYKFFADQWGNLSKAVGLDALVLRDGVIGSAVYTRIDSIGSASREKHQEWIEANASMVKSLKLANLKALIIGYSSAVSAVSDWRMNCFDLESIARQGYLDAYIDQTWSGAWNEPGIREFEYWNRPMSGWTHQMTYMLIHGAVLAGSKVRHYQLTETFDAWESWDVIHTVPERLKWGIWAYSHAAVKTPTGLVMPSGAYISWCNQCRRLLPEADVEMLATTLNEAYQDASQVRDVLGPTLVYSRDAMEWQQENDPFGDIKEWIDEYAGALMKWPMPIFSSTRIEYLPYIKTDLAIIQTPVHLKQEERKYIKKMIISGQPVAIIGSPAGGIDLEISKLIGIGTNDTKPGREVYYGSLVSNSASGTNGENIKIFPVRYLMTNNYVLDGAKSIYQVMDKVPALNKTTLKLTVTGKSKMNQNDFADWAEPTLVPLDKNKKNVLVSQLEPLSALQTLILPQMDKSATCGPLQISDKTYNSGIGVHAASELTYALSPGIYQKFESWIGLDDESAGKGSVIFNVYTNDSLIYQSPVISNSAPATFVSVDIPSRPKRNEKVEFSPVLIINNSEGKKVVFWDPPQISSVNEVPLINQIGGSVIPYVLVDSLFSQLLNGSKSPVAESIQPDQPMNIGAWQLADGSYRILAGNLEENLQFGVDKALHVELIIPSKWNLGKKIKAYDSWKKKDLKYAGDKLSVDLKRAECTVISIINGK